MVFQDHALFPHLSVRENVGAGLWSIGAKERNRVSGEYMEMMGIKPGDTLVFARGENITSTVINRHEVEFEGEPMSLTASALIIIKRLGYTWDHIAGPQYWMFDGETLYRRKKRLETE